MERFFVVKGNDQGNRFEITADIVTIGRGVTNRIQLRDAEVSRRHAEIRTVAGSRVLFDRESSNGVYVNGNKTAEHTLINGDQIQIGRTLLVYSFESPKPEGGENPAVDFSQEEREGPPESRIVHSYKQDEAKDLFQIAQPKAEPSQSDTLQKARAYLNLIYHTTLEVSQTLDIDQLLSRIMELIFEWIDIDRGCILLYNAEGTVLVPKVSRGRSHKLAGRLTISQALINYVTTKKEGVLTYESADHSEQKMAGHGVREAICVPMRGRYGPVGVVYLDIVAEENMIPSESSSPISSLGIGPMPVSDPVDGAKEEENRPAFGRMTVSPSKPKGAHTLTEDHLKLVLAVAHQAALAVEETQYYLAMMQSERLAAVGQTVAVLSHHIKNILQGIRGGSFLIERGLSGHDEAMVGKGWKIVEKNQNKISDLILDMLTFSKERTPVFLKTDINETVGDVVELMQGRSLDLGIEVEFYPTPNIPKFYSDSEQIHRAVTNLVTNAIDAVLTCGYPKKPIDDIQASDQTATLALTDDTAEDPQGEDKPKFGRVNVHSSFDPKARTITILVDDNGPGIPIPLRAELFRPFFSKNKSSGTGLGLAVTAKIIHEHKGEITIADSPLGGARFIVELPFIDEKPEEAD